MWEKVLTAPIGPLENSKKAAEGKKREKVHCSPGNYRLSVRGSGGKEETKKSKKEHKGQTASTSQIAFATICVWKEAKKITSWR